MSMTWFLPAGTKYRIETNSGTLSEKITLNNEAEVKAFVIEGPVHVYEADDGMLLYVDAEDEVSTVKV